MPSVPEKDVVQPLAEFLDFPPSPQLLRLKRASVLAVQCTVIYNIDVLVARHVGAEDSLIEPSMKAHLFLAGLEFHFSSAACRVHDVPS